MFKTTRPFFIIVLSAVVSLHCPVARSEWVEWLADANVSGQYDSNSNRASFAAQQREDYLGKALLSAGRAYQLDSHSRAYLTADWNGETHENYAVLDQQAIGGKGVLTYKWGLGRQAPVLSVELAGGEIFSASQLRSGEQFNAGLRLSTGCNEFLQGYAAYRFDDRNASNTNRRLRQMPNNVFALQGHTLEVGNSLVLGGHMQLALSYSHRWGGIISNGTNYGSNSGYWQKVDAVSRDDAFPGWTYRAEGNTHFVNVGLSHALFAGHAAAALHYSYQHSEAVGLAYQSHQVQFGFNYSY